MSRTWNTAPWQVQERRLRKLGQGWRFIGYPPCIGGAQPLRHEYAHGFEVRFRQRVRDDLHHGREPPPKIVRSVRWWIW